MSKEAQIKRQLDLYKNHFSKNSNHYSGQNINASNNGHSSLSSESALGNLSYLRLPTDNKVQHLIESAQAQNPTKLKFMEDDKSETSSFIDSSEAGSFYNRHGSQNIDGLIGTNDKPNPNSYGDYGSS